MAGPRALFPFPSQAEEYRREDARQAMEDQDRALRVEMLKQRLYPEQEAKRVGQALMASSDPVEQAALMNRLAETTGTRAAPGTSIVVPAGLPEELVDAYVDRQVNKVKYYKEKAMMEQDPEKRRIMMSVADAGEKALVAKGKELTQADFAFESNIREAYRMADELENTVKKYGNFETMDPEGSATMKQIPYLFAVSLAKVLDPGSVAREGEVEAARKFAIPMGTTPVSVGFNNPLTGPTTATTLAAIKSMRTRLKARAEDYKSIAGRTVELPKSNLDDQSQGQQAGQAGQQQQAPQQPAQRPMSPTGFGGYDPRTRKVIQNR
jgi:predicted esterase YcpF (UPF0227 family)